jgi:copper chaperone
MTQIMTLHVDNLKCGGCANTISKSLSGIPGVTAIDVRPDTSEVMFTADPALRTEVADKLRSIGYPETGTISGVAAGVASAKSYVSCAIGTVTKAA